MQRAFVARTGIRRVSRSSPEGADSSMSMDPNRPAAHCEAAGGRTSANSSAERPRRYRQIAHEGIGKSPKDIPAGRPQKYRQIAHALVLAAVMSLYGRWS